MNRPIQNRQAPQGWRGRWMTNLGMYSLSWNRLTEYSIPQWLTGKAMVFFFVAMITCWMAFGYVPGFDLWIVASISVVLFFYGGFSMSRSWTRLREKRFLRNVFIAGLIIRFLWVLYIYFIFNPGHYGNNIGDGADVEWYMPFGMDVAQWLAGESKYSFSRMIELNTSAIDDIGYPMWLGIIYYFTGEFSDVFVPMVIKTIVSAFCAILMYRVAKRHFGDGVARMTAIFICVNPNMIYWSASMMKEAEMVFLCCLALDNFDRVLTSGRKYTFRALLPGILAGLALFFFRMALGLMFFMAVFAHILMTSNKVMSFGRKVLAGILVLTVLGIAMGDRIRTQAEDMFETAQSDSQSQNMEWRGKREGGNSFAKYASAAVFAPLIFTIPFPTFNEALEGQLLQMQLSGGAYIKNILSFFVVLVMILLLISGEWRRHVFILAYMMGYLLVLVMSNYAHSGRFHMPIWPIFLLFAAYGVQVAKTNGKVRKWFPIALVLEVAICLVWNWFKLKGRGMI